MKYNMKQWLSDLLHTNEKKPMPLLSFPSVSLIGVKVGDIISNSEMQARGMKAVAERTDAAASVSFMDLSVEAECFGAKIVFSDDEVPTVDGRIIEDIEDADTIEIPAVGSGRTQIYIDAIKQAKALITDRPVLAGIIGPYSLAARLLDVSEMMMDCYDDPDSAHIVLQKTTEFLLSYARAYKEAGADGIVMAEPVAGLLSPSLEEEFSSPYVKRIVDELQDDSFIVIYHNCGDNVPKMLDSITSTGCAAYHFGNAVDIARDIMPKISSDTFVMGNIDPAGTLKMGTPEKVRAEVLDLLGKCSGYKNFLLSSGCDIPHSAPWENLDAFFAASKEFFKGKSKA